MRKRHATHDATGRVRKDFVYRRQVALRCGFREVTGRLIGLLDWMVKTPVVAEIVKTLRSAVDTQTLMFHQLLGKWYYNDKINARTIEEIAAAGLVIIEEAKRHNQDLEEVGHHFGIYSSKYNAAADTDAVVTRFIVPFLDYVEQRLPDAEVASPRGRVPVPALISESLAKFQRQHRSSAARCFIMMRFGDTTAHKRIEAAVKGTLRKHGFVGVLARDKEFHEDLFPNILTYIYGCDFGVAVFERLESETFNPNVALEVGYMLALRKHVLLLKDQTLRALHTDWVGKLYREFDPQRPKGTIPKEIERWLTDKGLA